LGSLTQGRKADLTVFSRDLFRMAPEQVASVGVEMTMVNGEVLYR
jgi:predicted amidohydrolase YtcJ